MRENKKAAIVIGAVIAILFALVACGWGGLLLMVALSQPTDSGAVAEAEREPAPSPSKPDRSCTIRIPGEPSMRVPVFGEKSDYDDWGEAAAKDDVHGQAQAVRRSGMMVEPGTKCLRLEGFLSVKVRILDGPFEGRSGWVPTEWAR